MGKEGIKFKPYNPSPCVDHNLEREAVCAQEI